MSANSTSNLQIIISARDLASNVLRDVNSSTKSFGASLGNIAQVATGVFAGNLISTAIGAVGTAIKGTIGQAADFQSAMSAVGAVAGANNDQLAQLSAAALQLGQDTTLAGVDATDAAAAMQELAAGGVSVSDIMGGAARGALLLASAGGIDFATAADIATNSLNAFGLAGADMAHVADLFAAAANASSANVQDIGYSMQYVGPIAHNMGLSIDETTAAIAELGSQGIRGEQAGTTLRSMLVSLSDPSKQAKKLMTDLGLQFFDSQGHIKGLTDIAGELSTKLAGLTDQQREAALATLFGNNALTGTTVLYSQGASGLQSYLAQVSQAGSAAANGAARNDNLKGSIQALQGAWQTFTIKLADAFLPAIRAIVDVATRGVGGLISFGGSVSRAIGAVVDSFTKLRSGQINLAQFIGGLEIWVTTIRNNLFGLETAPIGPIRAFFGAIGAGIKTYAPQLAAQFQLYAHSFVDWIRTTAIPLLLPQLLAWDAALLGWITGTAIPSLLGLEGRLAGALVGWIQTTAIPFLRTNLPPWLDTITTWITGTALPALGLAAQGLGHTLADWINTSAIPFLQTTLPQWYIAIEGWVLGTAVPKIAGVMLEVGKAFGGWLFTDAIPFLATNLPRWYLEFEKWLYTTALPGVIGGMAQVAVAFGGWIAETAIPYLVTNLPLWQRELGLWLLNTAIPNITSTLAGLGRRFGEWINTEAVPALRRWLPVLQAVFEGLGSLLLTIMGNLGRDLGVLLAKGVLDGIINLAGAIDSALPDWMKKLIPGYSSFNVDALKGIVDQNLTTVPLVSGQDTQSLEDKIAAAVAKAQASTPPPVPANISNYFNVTGMGMDQFTDLVAASLTPKLVSGAAGGTNTRK